MTLARFITANLDQILEQWESFARTLLPSSATMDSLALRDHAQQILEAIARDIVLPRSPGERREKSEAVDAPANPLETAAAIHGTLRHSSGFDLRQLFAEFRALRASVLRLWGASAEDVSCDALYQMTRFNESIDQALAESVARFSDDVAKSRDTFIAILGHDLRNPLQAVAASATILSAPGASQADRAEAVARIRTSSLAMSQMIRNLLEYTHTRLGRAIPINPERANLKAIVRQSLGEVQAGHPQRSFRYESGGDLAASVDAARLQQAITNLLSHALRHGRAGSAVKLVAREDGDSLAIEVSNEGARIAEDAMQVIFEPLVQLARVEPGGRSSSDLELGLFIAREIAMGHGGTIEAASSDRCTTFTMRIPREAVPSRPAVSV